LGTFAPDDQAFEPITEGAISQAALSMAPDVSRMEPVGLSFQKDAPKPAKILTPAPERPKLTAPPKPVPAAPLAVSNSSGPVTYTLLLGSFGKPENAERLRLQLVEEGLPVLVSEHKGNDNKIWYRVMSGDFDSQAEAESYGVELRKKFNIDKTFIFKNKK
jgi:cell division protein FtsN